ncbi:MAG: ATP-binding cassette domain-containing protein [Candidatus Neomarinimicrobiota bacterium]|nr:MAG: ATP-binding cassette domain-containing protein [Candidatus Neomarinimicrobiota bacterium]
MPRRTSFIRTWDPPRVLSGVCYVTEVRFLIGFPHFSPHLNEITFSSGLHVIYGESGTGKSQFARFLSDGTRPHSTNFSLQGYDPPSGTYLIPQNPTQGLIATSVINELAFSLECRIQDSNRIQEQVSRLVQHLPDSIDPGMHPVDLSGGEMEILNLVLASSLEPSLLVIDDGLSFLNEYRKEEEVRKLRALARERECPIIWLTTEWNDLRWGDSRWRLSLSEFVSVSDFTPNEYSPVPKQSGSLKITLDDLTFGYPGREKLLSQLQLTSSPAAHLGILGDNGVGKTTLALLLMGILSPDAGSISIQLDSFCRPCYIDQFPERMLGVRTLGDWVEELMEHNLLSAGNLDRAQSVLTQLQLPWDSIREKQAWQLPWSVVRLAVIAVCSYADFDPIIMDEPTFGLGWRQRVTLRRFILRNMRRKHSILISHDQSFVLSTCDQVLALESPERLIEVDPEAYVPDRKKKNH